MRIQFNQAALNSYRQQGMQGKFVSRSMEKLSSGMQINRAADDAAGMTISEKMRGQIRGLQQANRNIQDGISLVQTAESGMGETQSILQRVRELAVKAATDTNTDKDRLLIQEEIEQLLKEVDSVAENTEFNTMPLLGGRHDLEGNETSKTSLADAVESITDSGGITDTFTYKYKTVDGQGETKDYASAIVDFSNITSEDEMKKLIGEGFHYTCATCSKAYSIKFVEGNPDQSRLNASNPVMEVDITGLQNGEDLVEKILEVAYGEKDFEYEPIVDYSSTWPDLAPIPSNATGFVRHYSQLAADGGRIYIFDYRDMYADADWPKNGRGIFEPYVFAEVGEGLFQPVVIQNGSNTDNNITLRIPNVTREQLGIAMVSVRSQEEADAAIGQIDVASNEISQSRAILGAYQNRLEHMMQNNANYEENLAAAESRLRDTDMPAEISRLQAKQVLLQAAQAMGAQANQQMQGILQLLQ